MKNGSGMRAFSSYHQGASHIKAGKICQDYAIDYEDRDYAVAIVCDGHGSDNYFRSDQGAKFAGEAANEAIQSFMKKLLKKQNVRQEFFLRNDDFLKQLESNIITRWHEFVDTDYKKKPFTNEEKALMTDKARQKWEADKTETVYVKAYGTTLIAIVMCADFWFGLHIGDGKCVACYNDGMFNQPIPWDDKCFLNITTSICDSNASDEFRHCFFATDKIHYPIAIFIGTDGVDDSFNGDEQLYNFYKELLVTFREKEFDAACKEISDFLPEMSAKASGDDISVAGIVFVNKLKQ